MSKVLKNSLVYVVLGFLPLGVNFILFPIYTELLDSDQYGLITLGTLVQSTLVNIIGLGMAGAFSRFYYDYFEQPKELNSLYSTSILFVLSIGLFVFLLMTFLGDAIFGVSFKNDQFTFGKYGIWVSIDSTFIILQALILSLYRNNEDAKGFAFLSILFFLCSTIGIFMGVVVLRLDALGSIAGRAIGTITPVLFYLLYFFAKHKISFDTKKLKELLNYGLPLVPYSLLALAFNSVDKIIVERFYDLDILGQYGIAILISSLIAIFINSINSAVLPQVFRLMKDGEDSSLKEANRILRFMILFILIMVLGLNGFGIPVFKLLINEEYHPIIYYLPILVLAKIPRLFFVVFSIPVFFYKKTKILPLLNLVSLSLGVGLHLVFNKYLGIFGACITVFLIQLSQFLFIYYFNKYKNLNEKALLSFPNSLLISTLIILATTVTLCTQFFVTESVYMWLYSIVFFIFSGYIVYQYRHYKVYIENMIKQGLERFKKS